jgi:hypothetical protein
MNNLMDDKNWPAFLYGTIVGMLAGIAIVGLILIYFS